MEQREKELLDIYERFESTKSAQGAMDFVRRNIGAGREPLEFDLASGICQPVAVDLGLPSGVKWADRNIGAKSPEDVGLYFSWGNTRGVEFGKVCNFGEESYDESEGAKLDGNLDAEHDAATVNMGKPWRMPTSDEFLELYDNCEWKYVAQNGYYGVRFTSKINGNRLFFACSGFGTGRSWSYRGSYGLYWSSSFVSARYARFLYFYSGGVNPQINNYRYYGFAVRSVQN